jgi:hypothetical protein
MAHETTVVHGILPPVLDVASAKNASRREAENLRPGSNPSHFRAKWPGQIGYSAADWKPTDEQKQFAQDELTKAFNLRCPGKPIPQLLIKKKP